MKEKIRPMLMRGLIALLYGLGLVLPLLAALNIMAYAPLAIAVLTVLCAACTLSSVNRIACGAWWGAAAVGGGAWLLALGGLSRATEILRAVFLEFSGYYGALPLMAQECALMLAVILGLAAYAITARPIGFYPALALMLLVMMVLWITDQSALAAYLIPSAAALILIFVRTNHEQVSLRAMLPVVAVAAAVCLAVPAAGIVSPTLKEAGEDLRQMIYDYLFFTEPRNVFSLSTEGYYPQGQTQLGGKAEPTDHPVMQVSTPRRVLLRGSVMDEYTGRMWQNSTGGRRYLYISPRWTALRSQLFNMDKPGGRLSETSALLQPQTITVRMLASNASGLFLPQRVRSLNCQGDLVPYFNNASEVFVTRDLAAGDSYTVTAPLLMAGDVGVDTIVSACEGMTDNGYASVAEVYLQLPSHLQKPVYDLAARIVEGASTPYDKAFAIQNYLSRTYRYTLDAAEQDSSIDFVTNFLLTTKEGYCTYFASAMTILCRMAGLPARYVEGYQAIPDSNGIANVTGLNAHAWTEVYFRGFGWLTFDATPVQNDDNGTEQQRDGGGSGESEPTPTPTPPQGADLETPEPSDAPTQEPEENETDAPTPTPEPDSGEEDAPNQDNEPQTPPDLRWLWILPVLALLALAAWRVWYMLPEKEAARAKAPTEQFLAWVQALHDAMRVSRLPAKPTESPLAYSRRVDALHALPVEITPVYETISLVLYGKIIPEPEEIAMAKDVVTTLCKTMKPLRKARFYAERAFLPRKTTDFARR